MTQCMHHLKSSHQYHFFTTIYFLWDRVSKAALSTLCLPTKVRSTAIKLCPYISQHGESQQRLYFNFLWSFLSLHSLHAQWRPMWPVQWYVVLNRQKTLQNSYTCESAKHRIVENYTDYKGTCYAKGIPKFQLLTDLKKDDLQLIMIHLGSCQCQVALLLVVSLRCY